MEEWRGREGGYTMLELLVVLFIVGILATVSIAQVSNKRNNAVKAAAVQMAACLKGAQTLARSRGIQVTVQTKGATQATQTLDALWPDVLNGNAMQRNRLYGNSLTGKGGNLQTDLLILDYGNLQLANAAVDFSKLNSQKQFSLAFGYTATPQAVITGNPLFVGAQSNPLSFASNGTANGNFAVTFIGAHNGVVYPGAAVSLVLVTQTGMIMAYFKPDSTGSTPSWQRL